MARQDSAKKSVIPCQWPRARYDAEGNLFIEVDAIRPMKDQPRKRQPPAEVARIGRSIKRDGVEEPVVVIPIKGDPKHDYEFVSGETRWLGARKEGLTEVRARINTRIKTRKEHLRAAVRGNEMRRGLRGLEISYAIRDMLKEGCTRQEIMSDFGFETPFMIDMHMKILTLPKGVLDLMYPHQEVPERALKPNVFAYELAMMQGADSAYQIDVAQRVFRGEISQEEGRREIKRWRREAPTSRKKPKRRLWNPEVDLRSMKSSLARASEGFTRYAEFPAEHFGRMFAGSVRLANEFMDEIGAVIKQLETIRRKVQKRGTRTS